MAGMKIHEPFHISGFPPSDQRLKKPFAINLDTPVVE
jgi:hypothetical protein